jgi:hypothetical protein
MRKFILKTFIFISPVLVVGLIMEGLLRQIPNDYVYKKEYLDRHADEIQCLILGSSHAYYGVNPDYFSMNCFNASYVSQSLDFDYEILKKYENKLTSLKTLLLPVSYFTFFTRLGEGAESWRLKNYNIYYEMYASHSLKDYFEIFSLRFNVNIDRLVAYYWKGQAGRSCSDSGWGTSHPSDKSQNLKKTGIKAAKRHSKKNFQFFEKNLSALLSIIKWCGRKNIDIVLFTPPAFREYTDRLNSVQLSLTLNACNKLDKDFDNCTYLNLLKSESFVAKDFYDGDHLNDLGAKKLSLWLDKFIVNGFAHVSDSLSDDID